MLYYYNVLLNEDNYSELFLYSLLRISQLLSAFPFLQNILLEDNIFLPFFDLMLDYDNLTDC